MQCTELHMPPVNVRTAARLVRRNRSTLTRMIERGKISATRDESGRYLIDPAELERVFGALASPDADADAEPDAVHENALVKNALERELEVVREMLEAERSMHERERRTWEEERSFLRGLVEKQTDQVKLLTDQRSEEDKEKEKRRGWWPWRRGRKAEA
jgi:excisionase family DNA binding protein